MFGHDPSWVGARGQSRVFGKPQMLQLGMHIDRLPVQLQSVRRADVKKSTQHRKTTMSPMHCNAKCALPLGQKSFSNETH